MKKNIRIVLLGLMLLVTPSLVKAQPGWDDEPEDTPIEGGIVLLLGAGLFAYKNQTESDK